MGLLDGILGSVTGGGADSIISNLAAKVGLSEEQVQSAMAALSQAHQQPGDTVQAASDSTGLPQDKMQEIMGHLGGEGSLSSIAAHFFGSGES